ncbi:ATP-binding protein [Pectobacterium betavasculorum]|nr:ATP-binding protein [Pectobacterium betavasculorum]
MNRLRQFLPKNMANQLTLLLVSALIVSNTIAITSIQFAGALIHPVSRTLALERLSIAYQAADTLMSPNASALLTSMNSGDTHFWIADRAEVDPFMMQTEERRLSHELVERLGLAANRTVFMQLERSDGGLARGHLFSAIRWDPLRLRTSVLLSDGRYLNGIQHPIRAYEWSRLLSYSLLVASIPILLIVLFFIRRVVHPVKTLVAATDRVSRGEWIAPLPLAGPQEARELTQAFNVMQERIARHIEGRTRMLAAVSHDLNTPITELRLQVELLEEGDARKDMLESLSELSEMVSETLNFVRGDSVFEQSSNLCVNTLLEDLVRRYRLMEKTVELRGSEPAFVRARPLALKRALGNLIDNAVIYGGDATISVRVDTGYVRIAICDSGPGIAPENLDQVFEPFVQLGAHREKSTGGVGAGVGLGLSIARACIHAHGGELALENRSPTGLCATVYLPTD